MQGGLKSNECERADQNQPTFAFGLYCDNVRRDADAAYYGDGVGAVDGSGHFDWQYSCLVYSHCEGRF